MGKVIFVREKSKTLSIGDLHKGERHTTPLNFFQLEIIQSHGIEE